MFGRRRSIGAFRAIVATGALVSLALGAGSGLAPTAVAAVRRKPQSPSVWTDHFCSGLVTWQAAALDSRDAAFPLVRSAPPTDRPGVKTAALALDAALRPPTKAIEDVTENLQRRTPKGKHGAEVGALLATDVGRLADAYATARERAVALKSAKPPQYAKQAPQVLSKLDADLNRAIKPLERLDHKVTKTTAADSIRSNSSCRRIGIAWSTVGAGPSTLGVPEIDPSAPGADDVTAPSVLLPGGYRPSPDIAALAARTTMTGLGRLYFYASAPQVLTGQPFVSSCPSAEAATQEILGCYHDHHIYVLNVTRPDVATVVDVTAAHEMLHAVYEAMSTAQHALYDPQLSAFYDASADVHLHQVVPVYEKRTPLNRASELHSLIGSQVGGLTPQLEDYYRQFFKDRAKIVAAFDTYIAVFDNLINRYHELDAQLTDLRDQINNLRAQANAAGAESDGLSAQIQSLRAQGRIAESNTLVPAQNAAADRANGLARQANALIDQYNTLLAEARDVVAQLGGLDSALRPLG
jgi:hypothetical protein